MGTWMLQGKQENLETKHSKVLYNYGLVVYLYRWEGFFIVVNVSFDIANAQ